MSHDIQMQNKNIQLIGKVENETVFQDTLRKLQIEIISLKQSGLDIEARNKYISFLIFLQNNACYVKDVTPYLDNLESNKSKFSPVEYHLFRQKLQGMRNTNLPKVVEEEVKSPVQVKQIVVEEEEEIKPPIFHEDTQRDIKKLKKLLKETNEKLQVLEELIKTGFSYLENKLAYNKDENEDDFEDDEDEDEDEDDEDEDDEKVRDVSSYIVTQFCMPLLKNNIEMVDDVQFTLESMISHFSDKYTKKDNKIKLTRKSLSKFIQDHLVNFYDAIYPELFDIENDKDVKCLKYIFTRHGADKLLHSTLEDFMKDYFQDRLVFLKAKGKVVKRPRYL